MTYTRDKPNQQILDEAAEWFVDFREGDLDAAAQQAFNRWLRKSPEHITAYMEVAAFWADVPNVAAKEDVDVAALIAYAQGEDNIVPLAAAGRTWRWNSARPASTETGGASEVSRNLPAARFSLARLGGRALLIASVAVAMLGLSSWYVTQRGTYRTDVGEQRSVMLKDGSTVELNAKSRLRVRFTDDTRSVELLEGQALFRVTKDPLRPFVVSSGDASVRAVGTQFDVYRKKSGTIVTVIEGKVLVADSSVPGSRMPELSGRKSPSRGTEETHGPDVAPAPIFLSAGQQVVVSTRVPALPRPADISAATAWTQRQIVFHGAPLGEVVEEFNRYNLRQMKVTDEALQSVRVSGIFSSTEPASLLRFLREQMRLEVIESDDGIQISRR